MNKFKLIIIFILFIFLSLNNIALTKETQEQENDFMYSESYFDYLIECASIEYEEELEKKKQEEKEAQKTAKKETKNNNKEISLADEIVYADEYSENENLEPFHLRIQNTMNPGKYSETFKKEDTKIIIPVNDKFSFVHNTSRSRNKYSSTDHKILAGAEISPFKFLNIASGLETNYRDIDQNPVSRKVYLTPELRITDKIRLSFPNKYNISSGSMDHDIGLKISPFKSKSVDFGVYSGLTRTTQGKTTQSINFSTNIYLF